MTVRSQDILDRDGAGVLAGLDGDFFLAVQDAVAGVFDDDGDELAGVAGPSFMNCLLTTIRPSGWTRRRAAIDPAGSGGGGSGVEAARAPFMILVPTSVSRFQLA